MSRTTRKPAFAVERSRESWIKREIAYHARRPYTYVRVFYTEEENEAYYAREVAEYEERCKQARRDYWWYLEHGWNNEIAERNYRSIIGWKPVRRSMYRLVKTDQPVEEAIAEANDYYDRVTRDGWANETGRRSGYKHATARSLRLENRRYCHRVIKDDAWEDVAYPSRKEGKQKIWDFW